MKEHPEFLKSLSEVERAAMQQLGVAYSDPRVSAFVLGATWLFEQEEKAATKPSNKSNTRFEPFIEIRQVLSILIGSAK